MITALDGLATDCLAKTNCAMNAPLESLLTKKSTDVGRLAKMTTALDSSRMGHLAKMHSALNGLIASYLAKTSTILDGLMASHLANTMQFMLEIGSNIRNLQKSTSISPLKFRDLGLFEGHLI